MRSFRGAETHARSVLKAISWRTLGTLDTFAISWLMTGRIAIAGSIAALEIATKILWYYLHERFWAAIHWGRRHHKFKLVLAVHSPMRSEIKPEKAPLMLPAWSLLPGIKTTIKLIVRAAITLGYARGPGRRAARGSVR